MGLVLSGCRNREIADIAACLLEIFFQDWIRLRLSVPRDSFGAFAAPQPALVGNIAYATVRAMQCVPIVEQRFQSCGTAFQARCHARVVGLDGAGYDAARVNLVHVAKVEHGAEINREGRVVRVVPKAQVGKRNIVRQY